MQLTRLTTEVLVDAHILAAGNASEAPVTLAMRAAHGRIGKWMVHALGEGDWGDERFGARGRLALWMAGIPQKYPQLF